MILLLWFAYAEEPANAPPPSTAQVQAQTEAVQVQVQDVQSQTVDLLTSQKALLCYLKDREAVANKDKDVPTGWKLPEFAVYELLGATCSQIPVRQQTELLARETAASKKSFYSFPVTVEP